MKETEVKKRIETAYQILYGTVLAYHRAKYLNIGDSAEEHQIARSNPFINHARFALWYLAIVEACKLFKDSDNQKYNLHKLLNILRANRSKAYLRGKVTELDVNRWRARLVSPRNSRTTVQLINLRDQLYAHTDDATEFFAEENTPAYQNLEDIFQAAQEILFEVASKVLDTHLNFRPPDLTSAKAVLGLLDADRKRIRREAKEDILEMRRKMKGG